MKTEYSKAFEKTVRKLSGKVLNSVREAILEAKEAKTIEELSDCKKLKTYKNVYRKRIGNLRAFFLLKLGDTIMFEYLVPRGQAYDKKMLNKLRDKDG